MQDEGGAKGLNPALERHWEKLVLGVVAVLALIYIGSQMSGGGNAAVRGIDQANSGFKTKKDGNNPDLEPPKKPPSTEKPPIVQAQPAPIWAVGIQTVYKFDIKGAPVAAGPVFFLPSLAMNESKPEVDGVELNWTLGKETPDPDKDRGKTVVKSTTFFFKVERLKKGEADWTVLEPKAKGDSTRYKDIRTTPKTEYQYRVTLGATDPPWTARNPRQLTDRVVTTAPVVTPGMWQFEFNNVTAGDPDREKDGKPDPLPATVYVKIIKWDPEYGRVEWTKIHKDKSPLGFSEEEGKVTPIHPVRSPKKGGMVLVDFNCGGKIDQIIFEKLILYEYKLCKPKVGPGGVLACAGPETIKDHYKIHEILYTDEEGKKQRAERAAGPGPKSDVPCPAHGGAPPPRELTKEEKDAARNEEASKLLEDADRLWTSDTLADRKQAQEKYNKLVNSFPDVAAVKPRLGELKDRAKQKLK